MDVFRILSPFGIIMKIKPGAGGNSTHAITDKDHSLLAEYFGESQLDHV